MHLVTLGCTNTSCGTCPYLQHNVNGIKFNHSGVHFKIKTKMTCEVKDVIYVVTCSGCGKQYIGETEDLHNRVTIHNQQINHPQYRHLNVSRHIARCAIGRKLKYKICPILKLRNQNRISRQVKENYLIQKYRPPLNSTDLR